MRNLVLAFVLSILATAGCTALQVTSSIKRDLRVTCHTDTECEALTGIPVDDSLSN